MRRQLHCAPANLFLSHFLFFLLSSRVFVFFDTTNPFDGSKLSYLKNCLKIPRLEQALSTVALNEHICTNW